MGQDITRPRYSILGQLKIYKFNQHHYIDLLVGFAIIILLFIVDLTGDTRERTVLCTVAIAMLLTNMITKHKSGLTEILSVKTHLRIDLFLGILLGITPFFYGNTLQLQLSCVIFAMIIILNALFTKIPKKQNQSADLL